MSYRLDFQAAATMKQLYAATARAVEAEAEKVADEARRLAPVGTVAKGARKTMFVKRSRKGPDGSRVRVRVRVSDKSGTSWTARNPGTLRDSIFTKVRWKNGVCLGFVKAGYDRKRGEGNPDAFYAPFVEYGTAKMPARPFMRPAGAKAKPDAIGSAMRGALS